MDPENEHYTWGMYAKNVKEVVDIMDGKREWEEVNFVVKDEKQIEIWAQGGFKAMGWAGVGVKWGPTE